MFIHLLGLYFLLMPYYD